MKLKPPVNNAGIFYLNFGDIFLLNCSKIFIGGLQIKTSFVEDESFHMSAIIFCGPIIKHLYAYQL
jgi:hypothetical protein